MNKTQAFFIVFLLPGLLYAGERMTPQSPVQLLNIDGHYEKTPGGDIYLYPSQPLLVFPMDQRSNSKNTNTSPGQQAPLQGGQNLLPPPPGFFQTLNPNYWPAPTRGYYPKPRFSGNSYPNFRTPSQSRYPAPFYPRRNMPAARYWNQSDAWRPRH